MRLLLGADGRVATETEPLPARPTRPLRVGLAARPVDPARAWLLHKTTRREVYDEARASRPDCDDVLLWNGRGEVTESSDRKRDLRAARRARDAAGELRAAAGRGAGAGLAEGRAREGVVRLNDLHAGMRLWLVSALRGVREAVFVELSGARTYTRGIQLMARDHGPLRRAPPRVAVRGRALRAGGRGARAGRRPRSSAAACGWQAS